MNTKVMAKTEKIVGNTLYIVTSESSPIATETVQQKLERIIRRHISDTESYQIKSKPVVDMC